MSYNPSIIVDVGQIWTRLELGGHVAEYRVKRVYDYNTYKEVYCSRYEYGKLTDALIFMGYLNSDGTPDGWSSNWTCMNYKTFTKVSSKTLRKRIRDQLAATALTHRLTEVKEKS